MNARREIVLRGRTLLALGLLAVALVAAALYGFRAQPAAPAAGPAPPAAAADPQVEALPGSVFDEAREAPPSRLQVTPEPSRAGGYEVELGTFVDRAAAERLRAAAAAAGIPTALAATGGRFRVVAGPFASADAARAAAARLAPADSTGSVPAR